jgi:arylsulfatase A-like enzyme
LDWLEANDLIDDTIVIYTSDHGDYACEHGIMEKAPGICADAITRIPFIWRWPGHIAAGHIAPEVVESVDLTTTLCGLAELDVMMTSDGKDLTPLLQGEHKEVHHIGVTEFAWSKSVRAGKYRLVYYPREMFADQYPDGFGELYDLDRDPWEMENLYFQPQYAALIREMERDLLDWLVTTTRPKTVLPAFKGTRSVQEIVRYSNASYRDGKIHPDWLRNKLAGQESQDLDSFMVMSDRKNYI